MGVFGFRVFRGDAPVACVFCPCVSGNWLVIGCFLVGGCRAFGFIGVGIGMFWGGACVSWCLRGLFASGHDGGG